MNIKTLNKMSKYNEYLNLAGPYLRKGTNIEHGCFSGDVLEFEWPGFRAAEPDLIGVS